MESLQRAIHGSCLYQWIEGETAAVAPIADLCDFAKSLAQFLIALPRIDSTGGPLPGLHNFYRGGDLNVYDAEVKQAILTLGDKVDRDAAIDLWQTA